MNMKNCSTTLSYSNCFVLLSHNIRKIINHIKIKIYTIFYLHNMKSYLSGGGLRGSLLIPNNTIIFYYKYFFDIIIVVVVIVTLPYKQQLIHVLFSIEYRKIRNKKKIHNNNIFIRA